MRRLILAGLAMALLLATVPVVIGAREVLSRGPHAAATSSLVCFTKGSCDVGEVEVFRMSGPSNAHAQTAGGSYIEVVCCSGPTGLTTAATGCEETLLTLSGTDNAHVAEAGGYATEVTLSAPDTAFDVTYGTSCATGYTCVATISASDNAHVDVCDGSADYTTKVCAKAKPDVNTDAAIGSYAYNVITLGSDRIADGSVPNGDPADTEGDACETDGDTDNDGLPDGSDSDPGGDITYDDNNDGDPCVPLGTDAADDGPSSDADCNGVLDGFEGSCPLAVNPNGDDDADGLKNTWEACKWGTIYDGSDPDGAGPKSSTDSDGDGLGDCTEAADNDGNGEVKFGIDALNSARSSSLPTGIGVGQFGKDGDFDLDGDNDIKFGLDTLFIARASFGLDTDIFTSGDQFCQ